MVSKIRLVSLGLLALAISGCSQAGTVVPETPTAPPPSPIEPSPTINPPTIFPTVTPTVPMVTVTPEDPGGPPRPTLEPIQPPMNAADPVRGPLTITAIHMVDLTDGWALGQGAFPVEQVLHTSDGGLTWSLASPPEPAPASPDSVKLGHFYIVDAAEVWVTYQFQKVFQIPENSRVWTTADRGATWQASRTLPITGDFEFYDLSDFQRSQDGHGWFIAHIGAGMNHDYVALFKSSPDGIDWERVVDPFMSPAIQGCRKTGLDFLDQNFGWLGVDCQGVREGALFHVSRNGGATWEEHQVRPPDQAGDLFERAFCGVYDPNLFSEKEGMFVLRCLLDDFETREDYLYHTNTGGQDWEITPFPGGSLFVQTDEQTWALSRDLYQSDDGGRNWSLIKSVNWDGEFSFVDPLNGWAVARAEDATALVRTEDGGATWQIIEPQFTNLIP